MKSIFAFVVYLLYANSSFSQDKVTKDTIDSIQTVRFTKVKKSFKEANTALMKLKYTTDKKTIVLKFNVPSYIFRLKTTVSDYCVIETKTKKITLQNTGEIKSNGTDIISYYDFTFYLSKDSTIDILTDEVKKITFYFMPNPEIEIYLLENKYVNKSYDKLTIRNSKRTIKYTISKPDKIQYNDVLSWLNKL